MPKKLLQTLSDIGAQWATSIRCVPSFEDWNLVSACKGLTLVCTPLSVTIGNCNMLIVNFVDFKVDFAPSDS